MNLFPEADAAFLANVTSDDSKFHMPRGDESEHRLVGFRELLTDPTFYRLSILNKPLGGERWCLSFKMVDVDDKPHLQIYLSTTEREFIAHHMIKIPNHKFSEFSYFESDETARNFFWSDAVNPLPVKDLIDCGFLNDEGALVVHLKLEVKAEIGYEQYRLFNFHDPISPEDHRFTFRFKVWKLFHEPLYVDDRILIRTSEFFRKLILEDDQHEMLVNDESTDFNYYSYNSLFTFLQVLHGARIFYDDELTNWPFFLGSLKFAKEYGMEDSYRYLGEEMHISWMYTSLESVGVGSIWRACLDNWSKYLKVLIKDKSVKEIRRSLSRVGIDQLSGEVMKTFVRRIFEIVKEDEN